jgi:hypothetical protein
MLQRCADPRYLMPSSSIHGKGWQMRSTYESMSPYSNQRVRAHMVFSSICRPANDCAHIPHSFDSDDALDGKVRLITNRQAVCGRPMSSAIVRGI